MRSTLPVRIALTPRLLAHLLEDQVRELSRVKSMVANDIKSRPTRVALGILPAVVDLGISFLS